MRYDEDAIVRNEYKTDRWMTEERYGGLPITRGDDFTVDITVHNEGVYNCFGVSWINFWAIVEFSSNDINVFLTEGFDYV